MKQALSFLSAVCFLTGNLFAQDSTRALKHEVGFSSLFLVRQLTSNNPGNTLQQLPYDFFYNYYFNENTGMRLGLGVFSGNTKTNIEGQIEPRTSKQLDLSSRAGISFNIVSHKRVTINAFVDGLYNRSSEKTVNTTTMQVFPNPVQNRTTEIRDNSEGIGGQIGMGVKCNLFRNISIYTELPLSMISSTTKSEVIINEPGMPVSKTKAKVTANTLQVWVPATLYLVLRF